MRWLVTGAAGMLGTDAVEILRTAGHEVVATDLLERTTRLPQLDITSHDEIVEGVRDVDYVLNCAAWVNADTAESHESAAFLKNAIGPQLLARQASQIGARLIHISTDYVVDGTPGIPFPERGPLAPVNAYGRTKAAGEWAVRSETTDFLILRTAWLYGEHGPNFPRTIAHLASDRETIEVVNDQVGQPTWTRDVVDLALRLVDASAPSGIYHATASGDCSWFEFAQAVLSSAGLPVDKIRPTTTAAFGRPAPRPGWSVLSHNELQLVGVEPIGHWRDRWAVAASSIL